MSLLELQILISEDDTEAEFLENHTRNLRQELLQLDVESVKPLPVGAPPPGARGIDAVDVGTILVSVGQAAAALQQIVNTVRAWARRGYSHTRTVVIKIGDDELKITGVAAKDETRLVDLFVAKHAMPGAPQ